MKHFKFFEGKNKFNELISNAAKGEPQVITKNGTAMAVIISFSEYKRLTTKTESLSEFLLKSPFRGAGDKLELTRRTRPYDRHPKRS